MGPSALFIWNPSRILFRYLGYVLSDGFSIYIFGNVSFCDPVGRFQACSVCIMISVDTRQQYRLQ